MIRQDCEELKQSSSLPFAKYGCKLMSCFYFAEQLNNVYFGADDIVNFTLRLIDANLIDKELSVYEDMDGMNKTKMVLRFLGIAVKNVVYKEADYICKDNEHEILKLSKPNYSHFVPGDGKGNYSWDPLGIRPQQKDYRLKSKRVIIL